MEKAKKVEKITLFFPCGAIQAKSQPGAAARGS
jgi:hypothetical protein